MAKKQTAPVALRAVIARINRRLAEQNQHLKAARAAKAKAELGDFYIVDTKRRTIVRQRVSLLQLARELDAIQPWEHLEDK